VELNLPSKHLSIKNPAYAVGGKIAEDYYTGEYSKMVTVAILVLDDFIKTTGSAPHLSRNGTLTYPKKK
jgi:hypothetical protein